MHPQRPDEFTSVHNMVYWVFKPVVKNYSLDKKVSFKILLLIDIHLAIQKLWWRCKMWLMLLSCLLTQHLEPDIWEYEVKWASESITMNKAHGGDGIPTELFQILKDDAVKVLHSICQQIWKTQQWPQDWKRSVFIPIQRKAMPKMLKLLHNCTHLTR